jgi:hypothetical protein
MTTKAIAREVAETVAHVLTDEALADRLTRLSTDVSRFTGTERRALLAEAGRRLAARHETEAGA